METRVSQGAFVFVVQTANVTAASRRRQARHSLHKVSVQRCSKPLRRHWLRHRSKNLNLAQTCLSNWVLELMLR